MAISIFVFADDNIITVHNFQEAQTMLDMLHNVAEDVGLKIRLSKAEYMTNIILTITMEMIKTDIELAYI